MKEIIVTIRNGEAIVETRGFQGAECLKETAELEKALGEKVEYEMTPEYCVIPQKVNVQR